MILKVCMRDSILRKHNQAQPLLDPLSVGPSCIACVVGWKGLA